MNKIEILAPCGSFDSVIAAVRSGADAVYLGAKSFSARAGAENFSFEELKEAVDYCHLRGVRVHQTVNTVVFDDELEDAKEVILSAARAKVDALIVQNLGVAYLAKKLAPSLALHASTQLSIHSPSGVKLMKELGFSRVVLARELSRAEIQEIRESCPDIELEVFVHGALCMSVSGQCYFSAVIGSRSGNRGRCAQTCRLPFSIGNKKGYALSLKDNSVIDELRDMQELGVTSAKIEGRLKRPEYVSAAVRACVQSRDNGFVDDETRNQLESVFSRTGFTDGYYKSRRGYEMFGYRRKDDVTVATEKLFSKIRNSYKSEAQRVHITAEFSAFEGISPSLSLSCNNINGEKVTSEFTSDAVCERALNRPLNEETVTKQLLKTGSTPFIIDKLKINLGENLSLPVSVLNELRRNALEKLSVAILESIPEYEINDFDIEKITPHKAAKKLRYGRFTSGKIGGGFKSLDLCFVPFDISSDEIKALTEKGFRLGAEIPRALFSREDKVRKELERLRELGINDALCNNFAAVGLAKEYGMKIHGGFGLNLTNTLDLKCAEELGFEDTELSLEITAKRAERLGADIPRGIITYGYLPVMLTRNCPNKSADISCRDCGGKEKMTDRLGKTFIFYCDGNATEILNTLPLDFTSEFEKTEGLDFEVFRFSVENYVEKVETIPDFISGLQKPAEKTHGLYLRGVY